MRDKPKVGQKLFSLNIGDNARHRPQTLTPVTVSKVGHKYFSVAVDGRSYANQEYHLEDWRERYNYGMAGTYLYETEQQWVDQKEAFRICSEIKKAFEYGDNNYSIPLAELRKIEAVLAQFPIKI